VDRAIEMIKNFSIEYGLKALLCIVLLLIGLKVIKMVVKHIHKLLEKKKVDPTIINFTSSFLNIGLKILLVIVLLGIFGVGITSFVAILGAVSFALGLALQGSLSNFAAGVILLILKPFKVGNFVEISGLMGTVFAIEIFSTVLKTPDNKTITQTSHT
jgi:small conductance mechanosensitive channel